MTKHEYSVKDVRNNAHLLPSQQAAQIDRAKIEEVIMELEVFPASDKSCRLANKLRAALYAQPAPVQCDGQACEHCDPEHGCKPNRHAQPAERQGECKSLPNMVNMPDPDSPNDTRIVGFRIKESDEAWGKQGLSEPLNWLRHITHPTERK